MLYVVYFSNGGNCNESTAAYTDNVTLLQKYIAFVIQHGGFKTPHVFQCEDENEVKKILMDDAGVIFRSEYYDEDVEDYELEIYCSHTRNKYALMTPHYEAILKENFSYNGGFSVYQFATMLARLDELLSRYYKNPGSDLSLGITRVCEYLAAYSYIEEHYDSVLNGACGNDEDIEEILRMSHILNLDLAEIVDADDGYGVIDYYEYTDWATEDIFL